MIVVVFIVVEKVIIKFEKTVIRSTPEDEGNA